MSQDISAEPAKQIEDRSLDAGAFALLEIINRCSDVHHLDEACRLVWKDWGEGKISDGESTFLVEAIQRRRPLGRHTFPGHATQFGRINGRMVSRFVPRQRQRSRDRKASRDRRRMLGGSGELPHSLRHHYTEGQRAVLAVIAFKIKRDGVCDDPIDALAAQASVGRTTVQTTLHEARRLGHITVTERPRRGKKNLTNIVRVCSREWLAWLSRGTSSARLIGSNAVKMVSTTKSIDLRKQESCSEESKFDPLGFTGSTAKGSG